MAGKPGRPLPGPVGVVEGQTIRLSVMLHPDDIDQPCRVKLVFRALNGKELERKDVLLTGLAGSYHDFGYPGGIDGSPADRRAQVKVELHRPPGRLVGASAEVFDDATGSTLWPVDPCEVPDADLRDV